MTPPYDNRDGMRIIWDAPVPMDDGIVLRADVFRPIPEGRYPVIMSYGPYAKGLPFQQGFAPAWEMMVAENPDVAKSSTNKYQNWEVVDPEKWVGDGYAIVRVDSRGAGRSPGMLDIWSPRETRDLYDCIAWGASQSWSSGKVGLNGISYYATNQWWVAGLKPPNLVAICAWEGAADFYRDVVRHGGLLCDFLGYLAAVAITPVQHGVGERGARNPNTGETVAGPETLSAEELARNRLDHERWAHERLDNDAYRARSADWDKVDIPLLSAANWGGQGLHLRGNLEGFVRSASTQKWLEVHGGSHWAEFYTDYGVGLQKRFFGHFLKGEDTGWDKQPPVQLKVRRVDDFVVRDEREWPLSRTQWTKYFLDFDSRSLTTEMPQGEGRVEYEALGDGLTFLSAPLREELEITGPVAAKLWVSSSTSDADLFVVLRVFRPDGTELAFHGSNDPRTPIGLGWLRASHRKLDLELSLPYRPYHTHNEEWPLTPGEPVEVDVEIWPTCIVVPPEYRIGFSVCGKDYEYPGDDLGARGASYGAAKGVGPFTHTSPHDRPIEIFGGKNALHFGREQRPFVLLPIIPQL